MKGFKHCAISLILCFCFVSAASENTVHVIIVGDTKDGKIGPSVKTDIRQFKQFVKELNRVAISEGYSMKTYTLTGDECSPESLNNTLRNISIQDDIVVFYYSGHGGRSHKDDVTSKFPRMCLGSSYADKWVKISDCLDEIYDKGPKFILMITDCCNSYYDRKSKEESTYSFDLSDNYDVLRKLFFESSGYASITAASPGQYGLCTIHGGYMTNSFLKVLGMTVLSNDTTSSWNQIFQTVSDDTYNLTKALYKLKHISNYQQPIFEVVVKQCTDNNGNIDAPTIDEVPPFYDNPSSDDDFCDNNDADGPNNPSVNNTSTNKIFKFILCLFVAWFFGIKIPDFLGFDGVISLVLRGIGLIIFVRALIILFMH